MPKVTDAVRTATSPLYSRPMIRRPAGDQLWLISRDARATLAESFANQIGNERFARLSPSVITAARLTTAGGPSENVPPLAEDGLPRDEDDAPLAETLATWEAAVRAAADHDAYAGLLVSLLGLSFSAVRAGQVPPRSEGQMLRTGFEINRFQNRMSELQETLRPRLGLRTDRPLRLGLADGWSEPAEEALRSDLRWLEALDLMTLAICRAVPPDPLTGPVFRRPREQAVRLRLDRPRADRLVVAPWPFDAAVVEAFFPYRAVQALPFRSATEFAETHRATIVKEFRFVLCPA